MSHLTDQTHRVLQTDLVLDNIFSRLSLSDVKSCRLVCSNWESVSRNHFNDLSIVSFHCFCNDKNASEASNLMFTRFYLEDKLFVQDVEKLFQNWRCIKELRIFDLDLVYCEAPGNLGQLHEYYMSNLNGLNLTELSVDAENGTTLIIPTNCIGSIKTLYLRGVTVLFNGRIAPTKLDAEFEDCVCNGKHLELSEILDLNEYVDMTNLKVLKLNSTCSRRYRIDVTHCLKLEKLKLYSADIVGWHNNLILKRLDIVDVSVNLSILPPSIEEFNINLDWGGNSTSTLQYTSSGYNFDHLKSLGIWEDIPVVSRYTNLVRLVAGVSVDRLNMDNLSPSVRIISVRSTCEFMGEREVRLDKLIIDDQQDDLNLNSNYCKCVNKLMRRLNPKTVVFTSDFECSYKLYCKDQCDSDFEVFRIILQNQMKKGRRFVLKKVSCLRHRYTGTNDDDENEDYYESPELLQIVDGQEHFTLCENGTWKTISKREYKTWLKDY